MIKHTILKTPLRELGKSSEQYWFSQISCRVFALCSASRLLQVTARPRIATVEFATSCFAQTIVQNKESHGRRWQDIEGCRCGRYKAIINGIIYIYNGRWMLLELCGVKDLLFAGSRYFRSWCLWLIPGPSCFDRGWKVWSWWVLRCTTWQTPFLRWSVCISCVPLWFMAWFLWPTSLAYTSIPKQSDRRQQELPLRSCPCVWNHCCPALDSLGKTSRTAPNFYVSLLMSLLILTWHLGWLAPALVGYRSPGC